MPKQCKADGCTNNVFSHGYCQGHGYMWKKPSPLRRTAIKKSNKLSNKLDKASSKTGKKLDNSLHKKRYTKSIKRTSSKRSQETALYEQAKINVRKKLQEKGEWKCFFTCMEIPDDYTYWHHALGKEGPLLYDEDNIRPVQNQAHTDYHHQNVNYLIEKTDWYIDFIKRMYLIKPDVFAIEARRMMKSGNGLAYFTNYFGELVNEIHKH